MGFDKGIAFRFSYSTQPRDSDNAKILMAAAHGEDVEKAYDVLRRFPVVWKYYELIGQANGLSPEHPLVAEAYWHGSSLLDRDYDYAGIHNFIVGKFQKKFEGKEIELPKGFPHHNLHVRHYGIVSNPNASREEVSDCFVKYYQMKIGLVGDYYADEVNTLQNPFGFEVKPGNWVITHRKDICSVVDEEAVKTLIKYGALERLPN